MDPMADWTDGPEYAPALRPVAFVAPDAAALEAPPAPGAAALPPAPDRAPAYQAPNAAPLGALAEPADPGRDPREAFAVASTPLTSAPEGARPPDWTPQQPLALPDRPPVELPRNAAPAPQVNPHEFDFDDDRTYAGYTPAPVAPIPQPATLSALWTGASPAVWLGLLVGAWFPTISPLALAASLAGATRARYRRTLIGQVIGASLSGTAGLGAMLTVAELGLTWHQPDLMVTYFWEQWSRWVSIVCWLLVPVLVLIVAGALRKGEAPE